MSFFKYLASQFRLLDSKHDDYEQGNYGQRSIGRMLLDLLLFPIRVLLFPVQALGRLKKRKVRKGQLSLAQRVVRSCKGSFVLPKRDERQGKFSLMQRAVRSCKSSFALPKWGQRQGKLSLTQRAVRSMKSSFVVLKRDERSGKLSLTQRVIRSAKVWVVFGVRRLRALFESLGKRKK